MASDPCVYVVVTIVMGIAMSAFVVMSILNAINGVDRFVFM